METRTAAEDAMTFSSHVSSPCMAEDAFFIPDGVPHSISQPGYVMVEGPAMTANQLETLRRQICVYATICQQLVEIHKVSMCYRPALSGVMLPGQPMPFDSLVGTQKTPSRHRWAPSDSQLQILEKFFDQINGTPNKQKIKEITAELSQHGQITETNVYNWFQNRKARAKRKHQSVTHKDGGSGGDTDGDSADKKVRLDN